MKIIFKEAFGDKKQFYLSKNLAGNLDGFVKGVMTKKTSAVFLFDGRSGVGKTTLSSQIGCYLHNQVREYYKTEKSLKGKEPPSFTLDCLTWTPKEFIEKLEDREQKLKPGSIVIMDESMIISNRSTMSEVNRAVVIMMSLIRSKQLFIFFNINSVFDMDKNLPLHRADMLCTLYPKEKKFASRGAYQVVPASTGALKHLYIVGKKYYDYSRAKVAFRDTFTAFFPFDEKDYEERKRIAIVNYFDKGTGKDRARDSRNRLIRYVKETLPSVSHDELGRIANVSVQTIFRALQKD